MVEWKKTRWDQSPHLERGEGHKIVEAEKDGYRIELSKDPDGYWKQTIYQAVGDELVSTGQSFRQLDRAKKGALEEVEDLPSSTKAMLEYGDALARHSRNSGFLEERKLYTYAFLDKYAILSKEKTDDHYQARYHLTCRYDGFDKSFQDWGGPRTRALHGFEEHMRTEHRDKGHIEKNFSYFLPGVFGKDWTHDKSKEHREKGWPKWPMARDITLHRNSFDVFEVRHSVQTHYGEYQDKFGIGPCNPVSNVLVDKLKADGVDARLVSVEYKSDEKDLGSGHYIVGVYKDDELQYYIDATNEFDKDAPLVIIPEDPTFFKYTEPYVLAADERSDASGPGQIYGPEDEAWWASRLKLDSEVPKKPTTNPTTAGGGKSKTSGWAKLKEEMPTSAAVSTRLSEGGHGEAYTKVLESLKKYWEKRGK